jgi:hypothetical protein
MSEVIMAKMIRIERTSCPCCGTVLDGIEPIDGAPVFGAVPVTLTVCTCCGHLMRVGRNLTLRELTIEQRREAVNLPAVVAVRLQQLIFFSLSSCALTMTASTASVRSFGTSIAM